jgi:hypothetical protein
MKKITFLALVFCVSAAFAERIPGRIVKANGETMQVSLDVPDGETDFRSMQETVTYYDEKGSKQMLKADLIKEVTFDYKSGNVKLVSIPFKSTGLQTPLKANQENILAQVVVNGKVSIYKFFYYEPLTQFPGPIQEKTLLQKEGGELYEPRYLMFKKDMTSYLCDCPTVIDKIQSKQYKRKDLAQLVADYNHNCGY